MKIKATLEKYFRKRIDSINFLMEKPVQRYTKAYFHNLRIEIKKLHALFDLVDFCSKDFQSEIFFKPFKKIFKQAGKVRELHLQEEGLKRYALKYSIKNYFNNLKKLRLNEQRTFLVMKNEKQSTLKWGKYYKSILPYFKGIDKKDVTAYIKYKRKKIETLIAPKALKEKQVHQLRKLFKEFYYISKSSNLPGQIIPIKTADAFQELLGKWHDCWVMAIHLKKTIDKGEVKSIETKYLEKIRSKLSSDCDMLLKQINTTSI